LSTANERLRLLYEVSRRLATFNDLDELLRYATRRTRELFAAEGCSVLLLDKERNEFHFPVASQSEARAASAAQLSEVRFPADRGIAGWVLAQDQAIFVADTETDGRFYRGVDVVTTMHTRSLLCAPLRSHTGNLGVVEVINPGSGTSEEDLEFLEALAADIAVAHENAALQSRLRGDLFELRRLSLFAGVGLAGLGLLLGLGTAFGHLARALPLGELSGHPAVWAALVLVAAGVGLCGIARGWFR
jgi:GAF domain-containing protein